MEVSNTLNFNRNQDSVNSKVPINEKTSVPDPFTVHHSSKIKSPKEVIVKYKSRFSIFFCSLIEGFEFRRLKNIRSGSGSGTLEKTNKYNNSCTKKFPGKF
jgi:hypothetical protein